MVETDETRARLESLRCVDLLPGHHAAVSSSSSASPCPAYVTLPRQHSHQQQQQQQRRRPEMTRGLSHGSGGIVELMAGSSSGGVGAGSRVTSYYDNAQSPQQPPSPPSSSTSSLFSPPASRDSPITPGSCRSPFCNDGESPMMLLTPCEELDDILSSLYRDISSLSQTLDVVNEQRSSPSTTGGGELLQCCLFTYLFAIRVNKLHHLTGDTFGPTRG